MAPKQKFNFCQCVHKHYGDSTLIGLSIHAIRWRSCFSVGFPHQTLNWRLAIVDNAKAKVLLAYTS
ncbi:hypothetical protein T05_11783 [Trichinella murrelli]|uniref:Uncharacterized protein n=1 Tax=Trichinella murrelli TaxID=144512 RepID=A0A0V0T4Y7_9BILA|nr:hypothetical protein T05_11783 [Trichinella murrelli]